MFTSIESIIQEYAHSKEEILWCGHPVTSKPVRTITPILLLLLMIAAAFFLYAGYVAVFEMYLGEPGLLAEKIAQNRNRIIFGIGGGVFFLAFRAVLSRTMQDERMEQIYYAVTTRRAFVVDHANKKVTKEWGAGDIQKVSMRKRGESGGDIWFVEEAQEMGKLEGGGERTPLIWQGFTNTEDVKGAFEALQTWKKRQREPSTIENEKMKFRVTLPNDWSIYSLMIEKEHRDNLFFSIISAELIGEDRLLKTVKLGGEWNTLILTKRIHQEMLSDYGRLHYLTILVESALREELPTGGVSRFHNREKVDLNAFMKDPYRFMKTLRKTIMVCEFDNLCVLDQESGQYKARVNAAASKAELNAMESYEMTGSLDVMGQGYKFKQVYSYQILDSELCLHLRYTFFCTDAEKEKFFKENNGVLNTIVKSVRALGTVPGKEKAEEKPKEKEKPKK